MARNQFSALNLESDSEPEFDPEPLSRSCFGWELTVPLHFGAIGLEQQTFEPKTQTPETGSSADYLSAEERTETQNKTRTETKNKMDSEEWMIIDSEKKTSKLKLNQLKPFTGKWTEFDDFLQDIELYLDINEDIYNTDKKKIGYALSFMNEGDAKSWKGQFIQNTQGPTGLDLGTWMQFVKELTNTFNPMTHPEMH